MSTARRYEMSFFKATIVNWKHLLANVDYKNIIVNSLKFLVEQERIIVHAFVIMNNHIHILWHIKFPHLLFNVQRDFLKYTSQMMLKDLRNNNQELLNDFYVGAKDRKYQIWERNPLSIELWTENVVREKLQYIHNNAVKAGLCLYPEDYPFSTAGVYVCRQEEYSFVVPIMF